MRLDARMEVSRQRLRATLLLLTFIVLIVWWKYLRMVLQ